MLRKLGLLGTRTAGFMKTVPSVYTRLMNTYISRFQETLGITIIWHIFENSFYKMFVINKMSGREDNSSPFRNTAFYFLVISLGRKTNNYQCTREKQNQTIVNLRKIKAMKILEIQLLNLLKMSKGSNMPCYWSEKIAHIET